MYEGVLQRLREERRLWTVVAGTPRPAALPSQLVCLIKGFELHMGWHRSVEAYLLESHRPPHPSNCEEHSKLWEKIVHWEADRLFTRMYEQSHRRQTKTGSPG